MLYTKREYELKGGNTYEKKLRGNIESCEGRRKLQKESSLLLLLHYSRRKRRQFRSFSQETLPLIILRKTLFDSEKLIQFSLKHFKRSK